MKTKYTQQEILLLTDTTFSNRQWCENNNAPVNKNSTRYEQLENACWDGMLDEILPGVLEKASNGKKLYLWQMRHCDSFLEMDFSECPQEIDSYFSIDPYLFLPTRSAN